MERYCYSWNKAKFPILLKGYEKWIWRYYGEMANFRMKILGKHLSFGKEIWLNVQRKIEAWWSSNFERLWL